jgi:hypothetical protein
MAANNTGSDPFGLQKQSAQQQQVLPVSNFYQLDYN